MVIVVRRVPGRGRNVQGVLHIPHYWALFVHDGRGPFRKGRYMIWYRDPRLDPRLQNGKTPKRVKDLRKLTRDQWRRAVEIRNRWIEAGGDPYDAPVIITKAIRKPTAATPFFGNDPGEGMHGFSADAGRIAQEEFSRHVRSVMGQSLRVRDRAVASLRFRS